MADLNLRKRKHTFFTRLYTKYTSLDLFLRIGIVAVFLILITTPGIIALRFIFQPHAAEVTQTTNPMRGIFDHLLVSTPTLPGSIGGIPADETPGKQAIDTRLSLFKSAGITTINLWMTNFYAEALLHPDVWGANGSEQRGCKTKAAVNKQVSCLYVTWDAYGYYLQKAKERGIAVYLWYNPNQTKATGVEPISHPEWLVTFRDGTKSPTELDFAAPEMQSYEQGIILQLLKHYTGFIAGVGIEEPDYQIYNHPDPVPPTGSDSLEISYTDAMRNLYKATYGYDPLPGTTTCSADPTSAACEDCSKKDLACTRRSNIAKLENDLLKQFFSSLSSAIHQQYPNMPITVTTLVGGKNASLQNTNYTVGGDDVTTWLTSHYINYVSPEIYQFDIAKFSAYVSLYTTALGVKNVVPVIRPFVKNADGSLATNPAWKDELHYLLTNNLGWALYPAYIFTPDDFTTICSITSCAPPVVSPNANNNTVTFPPGASSTIAPSSMLPSPTIISSRESFSSSTQPTVIAQNIQSTTPVGNPLESSDRPTPTDILFPENQISLPAPTTSPLLRIVLPWKSANPFYLFLGIFIIIFILVVIAEIIYFYIIKDDNL